MNRFPSLAYEATLTAALWAALFAASSSRALLDFGVNGFTVARIAALAPGCIAGALMCLGMGRLLKRFAGVSAARNVGVLVVACSLAGILWIALDRLAFWPFARAAVEAFGVRATAPTGIGGESALTITFIFLAWAGGWFSVTYAEQLRDRETRVYELETLLRSLQPDSEQIDELWVPRRGGAVRVPVGDLVSLTAEREYVRLRTVAGAEFLVRAALQGLLTRLDPQVFVRIHRSAAVNLAHVAEVTPRPRRGLLVRLTDGRALEVGRNHVAAVRALTKVSSPETWTSAAT